MKPSLKLVFAILSMFMISWSCNKTQAPPCSGNCAPITATGIVINKQTGAPANGVTITLYWYNRQSIIGYQETITTATSGSDGSFNIPATIDTSYFNRNYFLSVKAEKNSDYMIIDDGTRQDYRIYSYQPAMFQNLQLDVYRKANLTLKWHKKTTENYTGFTVYYYNVAENTPRNAYNATAPATGEKTVETPADIFTKIQVVKTLANGSNITTIDSIKCSSTTTNVYDINF